MVNNNIRTVTNNRNDVTMDNGVDDTTVEGELKSTEPRILMTAIGVQILEVV